MRLCLPVQLRTVCLSVAIRSRPNFLCYVSNRFWQIYDLDPFCFRGGTPARPVPFLHTIEAQGLVCCLFLLVQSFGNRHYFVVFSFLLLATVRSFHSSALQILVNHHSLSLAVDGSLEFVSAPRKAPTLVLYDERPYTVSPGFLQVLYALLQHLQHLHDSRWSRAFCAL